MKAWRLGAEGIGRAVLRFAPVSVTIRAVDRMLARQVMLFAGGASFFALLALFPAFAVGASLYGLLFSADDAASQIERLAGVVPPTAQGFLLDQISQLADTNLAVLTVQGTIALAIALFASGRGAKAIIAGLNQIAGRGDLRNVIHFNLLAMGAVLFGGLLIVASNLVLLTVPNIVRPAAEWLGLEALGFRVLNEWTTAGAAMAIALAILYRYVMQRAGETSWSASLIGAVAATAVWLAVSKGFTAYVAAIVRPSAYGSLGALIVFLLWLYWASYAVFFGGALAVEVDARRGRFKAQPLKDDLAPGRPEKDLP